MNLQTFYETLGVDYNIVLRRLRKEALIEKYLHLLVKDSSFDALQNAVGSGDSDGIFRAAHTIKGMALNLEVTPLAIAAADLSDYMKLLGSGEPDMSAVQKKYEQITKEYETVRKLLT